MRVFRACRANRSYAYVRHEDVRAYALRHVAQIESGSIIDGSTLEKKFASLVKPHAPPGDCPGFSGHDQVSCFVFENPSSKIGTVSDKADETSHVVPHPPLEPGRVDLRDIVVRACCVKSTRRLVLVLTACMRFCKPELCSFAQSAEVPDGLREMMRAWSWIAPRNRDLW